MHLHLADGELRQTVNCDLLLGVTAAYDKSRTKYFEQHLDAECRSFLWDLSEALMNWQNRLIPENKLLPPARQIEIDALETELRVKLPNAYKSFLLFADGGLLHDAFIFYSVGDGLHPSERLLPCNLHRPTGFPVLAIGRDDADDFGFRKNDLGKSDPAIFFVSEETWETTFIAESFVAFIDAILALKPGEVLTPPARPS